MSYKFRKLVVFLSAVLLLVSVAASPSAGITRTFNFDYCKWRSLATAGQFGGEAMSETVDLNGGCSYIDADTKFFNRNGIVETKWCAAKNAVHNNCWEPADHHQTRGKAKSWETGRWQNSGWWA